MTTTPNPYAHLSAFNEDTGDLNVIIETPKDSRNKYDYDQDQQLFRLSKVLPAGNVFPFDFGYIPSTKGDDGDPLDVLVLMDEKAFPGCLITVRLIGVIEASQTLDGDKTRNDRLIGVATESHDQHDVTSLDELNEHLLKEIQQFLVEYHALDNHKIEIIGCKGPKKALKLVTETLPARQRSQIKELQAKGKSHK